MRVLAVLLMSMALAPSTASAFQFGAADDGNPSDAAALGARTSRVILDPSRALDSYDEAIFARRWAGLRPQLVIGGLTAGGRIDAGTLSRYAVAAFRRWPDAFSVSVLNEPELAGYAQRPCEYRKTFNAAYRALKAAGAPLVLFGEWSPHSTLTLTERVLRCGRVTADGFAWHAYDWSSRFEGRITNLRAIRAAVDAQRTLRTPRGYPLPLFITEYGQPTRGENAQNESLAAWKWQRALDLAQRYSVAQIVIYQIHEIVNGAWDTSLLREDGSRRPAWHVLDRAATAR